MFNSDLQQPVIGQTWETLRSFEGQYSNVGLCMSHATKKCLDFEGK